jgi:hypothetical protein
MALGCKDGGAVEVSYQVVDAALSGISVRLGLFWPV